MATSPDRQPAGRTRDQRLAAVLAGGKGRGLWPLTDVTRRTGSPRRSSRLYLPACFRAPLGDPLLRLVAQARLAQRVGGGGKVSLQVELDRLAIRLGTLADRLAAAVRGQGRGR
jgi:hypothetical protein